MARNRRGNRRYSDRSVTDDADADHGVSLSGTSRASVYTSLRQDAMRELDELEKELSARLTSTERQINAIDVRKRKLLKKREKLQVLESLRLTILPTVFETVKIIFIFEQQRLNQLTAKKFTS